MSEKLPSTLEVIAERIKSDSQPNRREDDYKVGVIFQGGAMRGVVSAGAGVALQSHLQETNPFDRSDDTSAGTFHWSYLVSGNGVEGTSIYYEELTRDFMSFKNLLRKGKLVDLSILMNTAAEGPKALDFDKILNHDTETYFYATSALDAIKVRFHLGKTALGQEQELDAELRTYHCQNEQDVLTAMEASAHLPWYAGSPVLLNERLHLVDGGLSAGRIPLREALEAGCTHILILATDKSLLPDQYRRSRREKIAAKLIKKDYPVLSERYFDGHDYHTEVLQTLATNEVDGVVIEVIRAEDLYVPSQTETDPTKLYTAAKAGEAAMLSALKPFGLKRDEKVSVREPRAS